MRFTTHRRKLASVVASNSGETLVETLISVLISSLALLMLATAIGASVNIIKRSRDSMQNFYNGESKMIRSAQGSGSGSDLQVTVDVALTRDGDGNLETTESVKNYKSTDSKSDVTFYERGTS